MVRDELTDGKRIGQLLASEIHGHERETLGRLAIVDSDKDVEPTADGAFAYGIELNESQTESEESSIESEGDHPYIASAYVHPETLRIEFEIGAETARENAAETGLRVETSEKDADRTAVFVENGADVKVVLGVIRAVAEEHLETLG